MFVQVVINSLAEASVLFVAGLSFLLIYRASRVFNFAHAAVLSCAPYAAATAITHPSIPAPFAYAIGIAASAVTGFLMNILVFERLERRQVTPLVSLIASLGLYIVAQNAVSMLFGDQAISISRERVRASMQLGTATVSFFQVWAVGISVLVAAAFILALRYSKAGKLWRAVVSDRGLSAVCGIDTRQVVRGTFLIGSALGGLAGILIAIDLDVKPTMGIDLLFLGVIAVMVGGGDLAGIGFGALFVGFARNVGAWQLSGQWRDAAAFGLLFLVLLLKPQVFGVDQSFSGRSGRF